MTKLTTKTASALTLEAIRVTPFNFTPKHRTFTVTTVTQDFPPQDDPHVRTTHSPTHTLLLNQKHVLSFQMLIPLHEELVAGGNRRGPILDTCTTSVAVTVRITPQASTGSDVSVKEKTRKRGRE
ncbi:unnamed protein product [Arabis nemorensis]|uniref:Uncharacterized protein n=1 Tax=Arabis nemorensis TaxID=586526 RepID=A0A565CW10_9BRAS|nr:unnamed protein product [Arabis nemorensis]